MTTAAKRSRPIQGQHLADLRNAAKLSQRALAQAIGEPQQTLANWELSERPPRSDALPKLAHALGVTVEEILNVNAPKQLKRRGPPTKLHKLVDEVVKLPRRQQERAAEILAIFLEQERRRAG